LHGIVQGLGVDILALGIDDGANHPVLAVRHAVDGNGLLVAVGGPGLEAAGALHGAHDLQALLGEKLC
jgi:hypothetical protein